MILHKKQAFSLTELLIVLVVIAILFAAMAPIVTKRRNGADFSNETVWNYVNDDDQMDAFFDPGMRSWTSTAVFGFTPSKMASPYAKTIIKAKPNQRMIQFRYGSGSGISTGSLFLDNANNVYMTSDNLTRGSSRGTTASGIGSLANKSVLSYSSALGAEALKGDKTTTSASVSYVNALGDASSKNLKGASFTTAIGALSNQANINPMYTVAIGGQSLASRDYTPKRSVYVGYGTGAGFKTSENSENNTILGSPYVAGHSGVSSYIPNSNTIIGYSAYANGYGAANNITAVGAYTCNSVKGVSNKSSNAGRTCIGYGSGSQYGNTPDAFTQDNFDRVFLGGVPQGGFNGRAVLEVHNVNNTFYALMTDEASKQVSLPSSSVVMNSNIAVRGGLYAAAPENKDSSTPVLSAHSNRSITSGNWTGASAAVGLGDGFCKGDWYISVSGSRSYKCTNKYGNPGPKSGDFLEKSSECTTAGSVADYPTGSNGCPNLQTKTSSDRRLKENISENNSGLKEILALKPYEYIFKSDKKKTPQVGVIAQDLQKVFPNSVHKSDDGYLHIRWDEMFYAMINAIKTLDKNIEKIASDISGMESDVKQLKSNHSKIQKQIASLNERAAKLERK